MSDMLVRIPTIVVENAKNLQKQLRIQGINRPLWECILEVQGKKKSDPWRNLRL